MTFHMLACEMSAIVWQFEHSLAFFSFPLLSLLLSRFSRVRFCATPQTAAHQAPLSLGFSRQEHWSGLPFPSPMHESESEVPQSCPTLRDPMDCSLPGSSAHGIFQARVLEWGCHCLLLHSSYQVPGRYYFRHFTQVYLQNTPMRQYQYNRFYR